MRVKGRITLLIHLWLMTAIATCYSAFIALPRRAGVLCTPGHPWRALQPLEVPHYPLTAAF